MSSRNKPMNRWALDQDPVNLALRVEFFNTSPAPLIAAVRHYAGDDPVFGLWLLEADTAMRRSSGLSIGHLSTWPNIDLWLDAYDDDTTPTKAAFDALSADPRLGILTLPARVAQEEAATAAGHNPDPGLAQERAAFDDLRDVDPAERDGWDAAGPDFLDDDFLKDPDDPDDLGGVADGAPDDEEQR